MEDLEHKVLCSALIVPKLFFQYIDDIIILWNNKRGSFHDFLALMNKQHLDIVLSEESEEERTLPFLDISMKRPLISDEGEEIEPLKILIYQKLTHSDQYLHFDSEHPAMLRQNILKTIWLRAQRVPRDHPQELKIELKYIKTVFSRVTNGYPKDMIEQCFRRWEKELRRRPEMLVVSSHLVAEDLLDEEGQQKFTWPMAKDHYPSEESEQSVLGFAEGREVEAGEVEHLEMLNGDCKNAVSPEEVLRDTGDTGVQGGLGDLRRPTMIIPFLPGIGDRLQQIANKFDVWIWYTFPGKTADLFNAHRGRLHKSKSRHAIYQAHCLCGL